MIKQIYNRIYNQLSAKQKADVSKFVIALSGKPHVKRSSIQPVKKFPSLQTGGLIISADFEMAWAFRYSKRNVNPITMADLERENIPILLSLFDEYAIPITWATVGHLFLESCSETSHDWMRRIPYFDHHWKYTSGDWFDADPHTGYQQDSAWYAPDMIEMILKAAVRHEIGCHTYSHILCSDQYCPSGVFEDELKACKQAAGRWGIQLKSMVFPGGIPGNKSILKQQGILIYREKTKYDLAYPYHDDLGLLVTPSTMGFARSYEWSADYYLNRFRKIIDKAIATNSVAHFWLHPSVDKWTLKYVMPDVLKYSAEKREEGGLWIGSMAQMAEHINFSGD